MQRPNMDNVKLTTASNLANQKHHANKVIDLLEEYVKKAINSEEILKVETDREIINLNIVCHGFVQNVRGAVDRLQFLMIKSFKNGHNKPELSQIAKVLRNLTNSIEQSCDANASVLQTNLLKGLQELVPGAHNVQNIMTNNSDGGFRNDAGWILHDLVYAAQRVYFYNTYEKKSMQELKDACLKARAIMMEAIIADIKTDPETTRDTFAVLFYSIRQIYYILQTIEEEADTHEGKLKSQLYQISHNLSLDLQTLNECMHRNEDLNAIQDCSRVCSRTIFTHLAVLATLGDPNSPDKKIANDLHNLILIITSTVEACRMQLENNFKIIRERQ